MFTAHFDVRLGRDRVILVSRETGAVVDRRAVSPFSTEHRLIADPDRAHAVVKAALREVNRLPWYRNLFGQVSITLEDGFDSPADRDDARRLFTALGTTIASIG